MGRPGSPDRPCRAGLTCYRPAVQDEAWPSRVTGRAEAVRTADPQPAGTRQPPVRPGDRPARTRGHGPGCRHVPWGATTTRHERPRKGPGEAARASASVR